jgi:PilZ domain
VDDPSDKRREARFPARIIAHVQRRGEHVELLTNDVSFRGAFIRTDAPPALRQLVKVAFNLPDGRHVECHAMVVHVVPPGGNGLERVPGVGVQFWGPVADKKAWEQYVYDLKMKERAGVPSSRATDKVRRSSERFKLSLDVLLDGKATKTRDVSETGMAIQSELPMPVGIRANMTVRAPGYDNVSVDVIVRRQIDEPGFKGLGVEFADMTHEVKTALMSLLKANSHEEDAIFIDFDDPKLH